MNAVEKRVERPGERHRIGAAFGAARDYDRHARVQREVAARLADRIAALPLPPEPRVLEIGCGTGFLTQALIDRGIGGDWTVSDIAPAMVERCRERVGEAPGRRFTVLDGEYAIPADGRFDLICSSLAMQWFDDQEAALARAVEVLAPGGHCLFATLAGGTFAEWRAAHARENRVAGTRRFESAERIAAFLPEARRAPAEIARIVEPHGTALNFLRAIKGIGAATPSGMHRPLGSGAMRRVMARFEEAGAEVTYEVVYGHYGRAESGA